MHVYAVALEAGAPIFEWVGGVCLIFLLKYFYIIVGPKDIVFRFGNSIWPRNVHLTSVWHLVLRIN